MDIEKIVDTIKGILAMIFGDKIPPKLLWWVGIILAIVFILWGILFALVKIRKLWKEDFSPLFYNAENKRKRNRRRQFADHIEREIRRLNSLEAWNDYHFAELEAEVEAEGRKRVFSVFPSSKKGRNDLRKEKSLSKALKNSQERLILVEGDPGSGKSVSLRYVSQTMARRAMKTKSLNSIIPIYINLKELVREKESKIDRNLIEKFIIQSLNRVNDRDIEAFLDDEFSEGMHNGTWLFLFDSFDELPEVLSSTEADDTIRKYGDAISDFLGGMNRCRGIIASRKYRGPGRLGWPKFRILPLSETRRIELIKKADLNHDIEKEIIGKLGLALPEIRTMASNPMFLGLLCAHMKTATDFPENAYHVFETFINTRLDRDKERLKTRFGLAPEELRVVAEKIAFIMTANKEIGLSPTRESLKNSLSNESNEMIEKIDIYLDALEFIKLARSETAASAGDSKSFTFAHRRFQEYFATCVVLREPHLVNASDLLTNARWRETAVTMCQTQPRDVLTPLLDEAHQILSQLIDPIPDIIRDPMSYINSADTDRKNDDRTELEKLPTTFTWPQKVIHVLGLLQDGFGGHMDDLPDEIKLNAARLIVTANRNGTLYDKKYGLEIAGVTPQLILIQLLLDAFSSQSRWIKDVAYLQAGRLFELPNELARYVRQSLLAFYIEKRLNRERYTVKAQLSRIDKSGNLLSVFRLLIWIPKIDFWVNMLIIFCPTFYMRHLLKDKISLVIMLLFVFVVMLFTLRYFAIIFLTSCFRPNLILRDVYKFAFSIGFRIFPLLIILDYFIRFFTPPIYSISTIIVLLYLLVWTPSAFYAVRRGEFLNPFWWAFMPFVPTFIAIKHRKTLKKWFKKNIDILLFFSMTIIFVGFLGFLVFYFQQLFRKVIFILMAISLPLFILRIYRDIKDWFLIYRWKWNKEKELTGTKFLNLFISLRSSRGRNAFVNHVREAELLPASRENEILIESLVLLIEQAYKAKMRLAENKKALTEERYIDLENGFNNQLLSTVSKLDYLAAAYGKFREGYKKTSRVKRVFRNAFDITDIFLSYSLLDGLSMLLEQIRLRRKD